MSTYRDINQEKVECPTCGEANTILDWDWKTADVIRGLEADPHLEITSLIEREEGVYFRCPNEDCEDEVITDEDGLLRTQDDDGNPIKE